MRLSFRAGLILAAALALSVGMAPMAQARARHRARPQHCPELRTDAFCHYDSGWHPAADNPLFSPLLPGDPRVSIGPACAISDSRGRELASYETEGPTLVLALRIGGRLVRFGRAPNGDLSSFVSQAGRLNIREGAVVARDHESDGERARMTFTDRRGRAHVASVRLDCWV
jgi:hypothetical protein